MKKSILNLGIALNKADQNDIFGGMPRLVKFECSVTYGDPRCCTANECGNTGGLWQPNSGGYGTSANCVCF